MVFTWKESDDSESIEKCQERLKVFREWIEKAEQSAIRLQVALSAKIEDKKKLVIKMDNKEEFDLLMVELEFHEWRVRFQETAHTMMWMQVDKELGVVGSHGESNLAEVRASKARRVSLVYKMLKKRFSSYPM